MTGTNKRICAMVMTLGFGLALVGGDLWAQSQAPNLQTAVENTKTGQDLKIQQLQDKLEEIQRELTELKQSNSIKPESASAITAKTPDAEPNHSEVEQIITNPSSPHSVPPIPSPARRLPPRSGT
jgi:hypothetical protein